MAHARVAAFGFLARLPIASADNEFNLPHHWQPVHCYSAAMASCSLAGIRWDMSNGWEDAVLSEGLRGTEGEAVEGAAHRREEETTLAVHGTHAMTSERYICIEYRNKRVGCQRFR